MITNGNSYYTHEATKLIGEENRLAKWRIFTTKERRVVFFWTLPKGT
jgi:hypothetical protein